MPRPAMPLTPAASTDIAAKEQASVSSDQAFDLPPPAVRHTSTNDPTHRPLQPAPSTNYSLPPPPTRSRTIIQMTPKSQPQEVQKGWSQPSSKASNKRGSSGSNAGPPAKKQPSSTSVAGKKIARKTAHSVIERRRRSKMNEEFDALKGLIPACTGQEMHKLAILQASIDYLRYLEECITDLKAANNALSTPLLQAKAPRLRSGDEQLDDSSNEDDDSDNGIRDEDDPMEDVEPAKTTGVQPRERVQRPVYDSPESMATSPIIHSHPERHESLYASSVSTLPSPAFGPQHYRTQSQHSYSTNRSNSTSTSPAIMPSTEQDEEATQVLLSLNKDRRYSTPADKGRRGMSVRDLLSN